MVHVDVGPGLVVTCGRLVEKGSWKETSITAAAGYYYSSNSLIKSLFVVSGIRTFQPNLYTFRIVQAKGAEAILKEVLLIERPNWRTAPQFRLLKMLDGHVLGGPLERYLTIGMDEIEGDGWIPFPVAIVSSLLPFEFSSSHHLSANLTA